MNVTCTDCESVFRVDPAKVPAGGVRARCSVCGGVFAVAVVGVPAYAALATEANAPEPEDAFDAASSFDTPAPELSGAAPVLVADPEPLPPVTATPLDATPPPAEPAPDSAALPRAGRPFNPYLSNTPELRARRLARALVSDLVAYNPQKREQGLRDGTLRQLFREEIRKSWEEYVEQVGANVAESTPHFQDALNDVLAGGRRVF